MPVAALHPIDSDLKALACDRRIVDAAGCQIEPNAANAGAIHGIEVGLGDVAVVLGSGNKFKSTDNRH